MISGMITVCHLQPSCSANQICTTTTVCHWHTAVDSSTHDLLLPRCRYSSS